jgi:hypothetical protein
MLDEEAVTSSNGRREARGSDPSSWLTGGVHEG